MNRQKSLLMFILCCLLCLIGGTASFAQNVWERTYGVDRTDYLEDMKAVPSGGCILAGTIAPPVISGAAYLVRVNELGDTLWTWTYHRGTSSSSKAVDNTNDGGFITVVLVDSSGVDHDRSEWVKLDSNGVVEWKKEYDKGIEHVLQTSDGGYMFAGDVYTNTSNGAFFSPTIVKTDNMGNVLWTKVLPTTSSYMSIFDIMQTSDGGYVLSGNQESVNPIILGEGYICKVDANGNFLWKYVHNEMNKLITSINSVVETSDGGFAFTGYGSVYSDSVFVGYVAKINAAQMLLWSKPMVGNGSQMSLVGYDIIETQQGNLTITGLIYEREPGWTISQSFIGDILFQQYTASGTNLWARVYGGIWNDGGICVQEASDGGFFIGGTTKSYGAGASDLYLIKTNSQGEFWAGVIEGTVFQDLDLDCSFSTGDLPLSGIVIKAKLNSPIDFTYYTLVDSLGNYHLPVQGGSYTLSIPTVHPYHNLSCGLYNNLTNIQPNDTVDLPVEILASCPIMEVNVGVPVLRQVRPSTYTINYCNNGTAMAQNAVVEVEMDPYLLILGITPQPTSQVGNTYTFNVGNVAVGACGAINFDVQVDTTAAIGQTHCVEAYITPDSLCLPQWNNSILNVEGACQGDSVFFTIENVTAVPSAAPRTYWVFEDDIIMRTGTINLGGNRDTTIAIAAQARRFYRLEVEQDAGIPWTVASPLASDFVEGCVRDANGDFNVGFPTTFANLATPTFSAIDCTPNTAAYDPNNKEAQPLGFSTAHYITKDQVLEYQINFQNTGNDTAFTVILVDTLAHDVLNPGSIQFLSASHPYTWTLSGNGLLTIQFDNILLPDSTTNEPASHGFAKFRIEQQPNNPIGTVIENFADIYFDLNPPVRTDTTQHEIGENFYPISILPKYIASVNNTPIVEVFPNPFIDQATFRVANKSLKQLNLLVYNMAGQLVQQVQTNNANKIVLDRGALQQGVYAYRLLGDGEHLSSGKVIVLE